MDAPAQRIRLAHAAGSGTPVVHLQIDDRTSAGVLLLTKHFCVLSFANPGGDATAAELAEAIGPHAGEPASLIADAANATAALRLATARPDLVLALALIAPAVPDKLPEEFKTPVMALLGTRDAQPQIGRQMREAMSGCHVMFVYDTDHDMANQRPEAVAAILREFLTAGDRFLVTSKSGKLYP
jgi:pimeloyl-ACP methyl ester carboxylesterase